jgi:hypothetical protein
MRTLIQRTVAIAVFTVAMPLQAQQPPAPVALSSNASTAELAKARLDGEVAATNAGGWFGRSVVIGALSGTMAARPQRLRA